MISTVLLIAVLLVVWYAAAGLFVYAGYPIALNTELTLRQAVFWPTWAAVALIVILQIAEVKEPSVER